jgi:hypothetical protein
MAARDVGWWTVRFRCCRGPSASWPTFAPRERKKKLATPVGMTEEEIGENPHPERRRVRHPARTNQDPHATAACGAPGASELQLLLVVDGGGGDFFAAGVGAFGGDGAGFAVSGEDDGAGEENLATLFDGERQIVIIDFLDGAGVGSGIAGDRIVFAIELAHPFVVRGLAGGVGAVDGDHHLIAHG